MKVSKAVIPVAGKGTRMLPLSATTPKFLIPILNRPLVDYFVDALKDFVDEIVLIVNEDDSGNQIKEYINANKFPVKFSFVTQTEQKGTAHALQSAKEKFQPNEKFIYMYGDDIYSKKDVENLLKHEYAVVGMEVTDPEKWGILKQDENGNLIEMIEKPKENVGNLANIGLYLIDSSIFEINEKIEESQRGELEFTDTISIFAKEKEIKVLPVVGHWIPVGYPWHILEANEKLIDTVDFKIEGTVEENVFIKGRLKLGKGSVVKSGTYMEGDVIIGENCEIGPSAYIRGTTVIGNECQVGNSSEVKNSVIMDGSKLPHFNYFGDGVMGKNVNFAGQCMAANLRHDGSNIKTMVKGELIDTGRRKFSTVVGDNVKFGAGSIIYPGRKIWPDKTTAPGEIIKEDLT